MFAALVIGGAAFGLPMTSANALVPVPLPTPGPGIKLLPVLAVMLKGVPDWTVTRPDQCQPPRIFPVSFLVSEKNGASNWYPKFRICR